MDSLVLLAPLGVGNRRPAAAPADEFALLETPPLIFRVRRPTARRPRTGDPDFGAPTSKRTVSTVASRRRIALEVAVDGDRARKQGDRWPSAIEELEELAWIACALRSRDDFADAELVSWSVKACLMDLTERDDRESHWIRGQGPSPIELTMLCRNAGSSPAVSSRPRVAAALQGFERAVRERCLPNSRLDVPADARTVETLERSVQSAAHLLEDLRSALVRLRDRQR
jgi:hypothetical protein